MRAFGVVEYGKPLVELDVPEPKLEPGYALLEVVTCGVCFSDVKTSRGKMPFSDDLQLPHIPGHEICGRVLAADPPGVFEPGELVIVYQYWSCGRCRRCQNGEENLCLDLKSWVGFTDPGGFQERLSVPLDRIFRLPEGIDPVAAAPMTCAVGTAYRATVTRGAVRPGSTVAVVGLGGVGIHSLQVAVAAGATAVGLDVSPRTLEVARGLGLQAKDGREFDQRHSGIPAVENEGFDVVIVTAGAQAAYQQAGEIVRKGGRIVCVGYALDLDIAVASPQAVLGEIEVVGSRYVTRGELGRAIELVRLGLVTPVVGSVRPVSDVNKAFEALEAGEVVGRTVLRVSDA